MNGRTKMMLAQTAARKGRGNDYGNPRDNEKPNNNYNNSGYNNAGGEMRDRPYYGGYNAPVNVIVEPSRERMGGTEMPENNRYTGYNEGRRYGAYNRGEEYRGEEIGYRGGSYNAYNGAYPPPVYDESRRIGFDGNFGAEMRGGSRKEVNSRNLYFNGSSRNGSPSETGVTPEKAEEWTKEMKNEDGSKGPHWSMEQTKNVKDKLQLNVDPVEFYVAMNMMFSDYCGIARKYGVDNPEFYAHMAKAFLNDKDAGPGKLAKYFEIVVDED